MLFILIDVNHLARSPIVFVLTDNCSFSTLNNPQLLFPQTIIDELRIEQISFNPIAPTLMKKALESVLLQASKLNLSPPSKECIPELIITSNGDLRSAINSLQFSSNNIVQLKSNGQSKLKSTVKSKDSSLSLFRALGRILYKKDGEDDLNESSSESTLHATPSVRQPPEDLIDQCHISPMGFIGFLFENYIDFYSSIDDVGNVCDYLSFSDQILTEWSTRSILTSVTSSMACRAVRYFNSKPIRRGFKPIRKPQDKTVYLKVSYCAQKSRTMLMSNKLSYGCSTEEYFTVLLPFQARLLTTNQRSSNLSARHITDVGIISKRGKWQSCGSVTERDGSGAIESGENNAQSDNSMDAYGTNVKNFNVQLAVVEYDDNVDIIDTDD
ncbi:unnamed protein product [Didymodactylos carnosus]|uniref:Checkpoint protein RAD24-like helical bundle domain-containing protein n=1 Tax=Didymodactylos carnosus TaxID=1234261 RepID=A0A814GS18_9BILA|nr:unnamed protein product [Didymodactylos carnosus]CAF3771977.1 unnamed protein product [Didymodactylos carnosus]